MESQTTGVVPRDAEMTVARHKLGPAKRDVDIKPRSRLVVPPSLYRSPPYQALKPTARLLLSEMVKLTRKIKNRCWLTLGEREAAAALGVDRKTARSAFKQLEELGFIVCLQRGEYARKRLASKWRITCFVYDGQPATKDYERAKVVHAVWRAENKKARLKRARRLKGVPFATPNLEMESRAGPF